MSLAWFSIRSHNGRGKTWSCTNPGEGLRNQGRKFIHSHSSQVALVPSYQGLSMIRCPTCGNDLVYSPIPPLFICLARMTGDIITINLGCKPWISENASARDLLKMTDRIGKLAPKLNS